MRMQIEDQDIINEMNYRHTNDSHFITELVQKTFNDYDKMIEAGMAIVKYASFEKERNYSLGQWLERNSKGESK